MFYVIRESSGTFDDYTQQVVALVSGREDPLIHRVSYVAFLQQKTMRLRVTSKKRVKTLEYTTDGFVNWLVEKKGYKRHKFLTMDD